MSVKNEIGNQYVVIEFGGDCRTVAEWARVVGISRSVLSYRLKAGWPVEKALGMEE